MTAAFKKNVRVLVCILLCQLAGFLGAWLTVPALPVWYAGLQKPWFNPPNWIFGPVWTLLYAMMGVVLAILWGLPASRLKTLGIRLFLIQLIFNAAWSGLFFGLRNPGWALADILILLSLLAVIAGVLRKISWPAFFLWLPYTAWVAFAAVLNYYLWSLNSGR
ncbi:MAG: tryptophan-rich sensory protein [Candidatus Omnitrophica bacterium]|nr:tryptophan-rich sensory protein [Candidatus Omnitrophota bacterium]